MNTLSIKKILFLAAAALYIALLPAPAPAARKTETLTLSADDLAGSRELSLTFALGGARVTIIQSDNADAVAEAVVTYDTQGPVPTLKTVSNESLKAATFSSGHETSYYADSSQIQEWSITIGAYDIDTDLNIAGGGISGSIELGGMPLKNCNLALGGVTVDVSFSKPASRPVEHFSIECGGITLSIKGIGNTDFQEFDFAGGGFTADLDFSGAFSKGERPVRIIGAGDLINIVIPPDAGGSISALTAGGIVSVQGSEWNTLRRLFFFQDFKTADYDRQQVRLKINFITAGSAIRIEKK